MKPLLLPLPPPPPPSYSCERRSSLPKASTVKRSLDDASQVTRPLVVPVGEGTPGREERQDDGRVPVARGHERRAFAVGEGGLGECAGVEEAEVALSVGSGLDGLRGRRVDDAADVAAVSRRGSALVEVDAVDERGVDDARAEPDVVERRDGDAVDEVARRRRRRAAHVVRLQRAHGGNHTGQRLGEPGGVAEGPGHVAGVFAAYGRLADFAVGGQDTDLLGVGCVVRSRGGGEAREPQSDDANALTAGPAHERDVRRSEPTSSSRRRSNRESSRGPSRRTARRRLWRSRRCTRGRRRRRCCEG